MPPGTVRPLALVAVLGGASYVLSGVVQLASPEQTDTSHGRPTTLSRDSSPSRSCRR